MLLPLALVSISQLSSPLSLTFLGEFANARETAVTSVLWRARS
jgi:hypothetical protein